MQSALVMWRLEPEPKLVVSTKKNPGHTLTPSRAVTRGLYEPHALQERALHAPRARITGHLADRAARKVYMRVFGRRVISRGRRRLLEA